MGMDRVQAQAIHRWFWRSIVLIMLVSIGIIICSVQQYLDYRSVRSEYVRLRLITEQLHACLEQKRSLKDKLRNARRYYEKSERARLRPVTPYELLQFIDEHLNQTIFEEIALNKRQINFVIQTPSVQDVLVAIGRLRANKLVCDISIMSLEQVAQNLKASLRAVLITGN